jgi:hypothetical protein
MVLLIIVFVSITVPHLLPYLPEPITDLISPTTHSKNPSIVLFWILSILFLYIFVWFDNETIQDIIAGIVSGSTTIYEPGVAEEVSRPLADIIAIEGQLLVIAIFIILNLLLLHPRYEARQWTFELAVYNAILTTLFAAQTIFGNFTPLPQQRLIIFFYPTLIFVGVTVLFRFPTKSLTIDRRRVAVLILLICFFTTQLAPIPSHVYYSNQSDAPLGESHYPQNLHEASRWASDSGIETIESSDGDVWRYRSVFPVLPSPTGPCQRAQYYSNHIHLNTDEYQLLYKSKIYESSDTGIYKC